MGLSGGSLRGEITSVGYNHAASFGSLPGENKEFQHRCTHTCRHHAYSHGGEPAYVFLYDMGGGGGRAIIYYLKIIILVFFSLTLF